MDERTKEQSIQTPAKPILAEVVYEQHEGFSPGSGGWAYESVGVKFGSRVVFLGTNYFPDAAGGDSAPRYAKHEELAKEIVKRWNEGDELMDALEKLTDSLRGVKGAHAELTTELRSQLGSAELSIKALQAKVNKLQKEKRNRKVGL